MKNKFGVTKDSIKNDLSGGLLAAIVGLPMGLAFGVQSGMGAQAGIYTAIILAIVAGLIGGTRTLISDPTGPMTVVAATVVSLGITANSSLENALPLIIGTFVLAGIFELVFGLLDFGKFVKFMPHPVVSSFMTGIGIIIISMQMFPFLGHTSPKGFLNIMSKIESPLANINLDALTLGLLTLVVIYLLPKITKKIPSILVALVGCTGISIIFDMEVPVIGSIPRALPQLHVMELFSLQWSDLQTMVAPAIMIGGLGVIDSLLTSVVADNLTKTKHNSRKTVIGQGLGNIITGLLGGIPGAGATVGTVTNIKAGGMTRFSGLLKGVFLLIIIVGVADYIEMIPMAVLASILITTGISIVDFKAIKTLFKVPRPDAIVWMIVLLFTIFNNLLNAVAAGFILACLLFIGQLVKGMKQSTTELTLDKLIKNGEIDTELAKSIHVQNLDGPLFFGFADQYRTLSSVLENKLMVIIRMKSVPFLDQSGLMTLEQVIKDWHQKGIQVYISGANPSVESMLISAGLVPDLVSRNNCFGEFKSCVAHIKVKCSGKHSVRQFENALLEDHILANRLGQAAEIMHLN